MTILSTGQSQCFDASGQLIDCAESGQDGHVRTGLVWPEPRFLMLDSGLVQDRLTGLVWPQKAEDYPMSWPEALAFVAGMNADQAFGHADWRLPNRREMFSLISQAHHRPALPPDHPFTVQQLWHWTSSTAAIAPKYAWHVHLEGGRVFYGDKMRDAMVWPVRGESLVLPQTGQTRCFDARGEVLPCDGSGQDGALRQGVIWPVPRFASEQGAVRDCLTGLLWMPKADLCGLCSWEQALAAARTCRHAGLRWRLPSIRELESLVDLDQHSPALSAGHPFLATGEAYWSSTTSSFAPDWAYCLYLHKGAVGVGFKVLPEFLAWLVALES